MSENSVRIELPVDVCDRDAVELLRACASLWQTNLSASADGILTISVEPNSESDIREIKAYVEVILSDLQTRNLLSQKFNQDVESLVDSVIRRSLGG